MLRATLGTAFIIEAASALQMIGGTPGSIGGYTPPTADSCHDDVFYKNIEDDGDYRNCLRAACRFHDCTEDDFDCYDDCNEADLPDVTDIYSCPIFVKTGEIN